MDFNLTLAFLLIISALVILYGFFLKIMIANKTRLKNFQKLEAQLVERNEFLSSNIRELQQEIKKKDEIIKRQSKQKLTAQTAGQSAHDIKNIGAQVLKQLEKLTESNTFEKQITNCQKKH